MDLEETCVVNLIVGPLVGLVFCRVFLELCEASVALGLGTAIYLNLPALIY